MAYACCTSVTHVPAEAAGSSPQAGAFVTRIQTHHANAPRNGEALRVVYFYPSDASLPEDYRDRVERIVRDIQEFYLSEMKRNGFADSVMPIEQENGAIRIHRVQGRKPAADYSYEYEDGIQIRREIEESLDGTINFDNDVILIICNLCTLLPDGSYRFNSPYYGGPGSSNRSGYCFVADCPLQDPLLLTDTEHRIAYREHYGTYEQTYAAFNTKYLGGIAHELGHGLGLSHRAQTQQEAEQLGTALMGSGNHTYRREKWAPEQTGSFLTFSACLQLAAHPLFTQSDRDREVEPSLSVKDLAYSAKGRKLIIEGSVESDPEVFAVIVFNDPEEESSTKAWTDYDAITSVAEVRSGRFSVTVDEHPSRFYKLRLAFLHLNGALSEMNFRYRADESGHPDAEGLNVEWDLGKARQAMMDGETAQVAMIAKMGIRSYSGRPEEARFRHLLELCSPPRPVDLDAAKGPVAFLSDVAWDAASVGWGQPARNHYYFDRQIQDALFLEPGGRFHAKGLYAHAPSRYAFALNGKWKRFKAEAGLQTGVPGTGSAIFIVKGDGKTLYESPIIKGQTTESVEVDVEGINRLELITESGKSDNSCCWSVWGSPSVFR